MPMPSREVVEEELRNTPLKGIFSSKVLAISLLAIFLIVILPLSGMIFETTNAGTYLIKQAAATGKMTAYTEPGTFLQLFGDVFKYQQSNILYFSKHDDEGKQTDDCIAVRFNDGATAKITGNVRIELPTDHEQLIEIHKRFRSYDALVKDTIKQVVAESVILTAALMSAEESYTTKRAEFSQMADDQVRNGVYLTESEMTQTKDAKTGEITYKQIVTIQRDDKKQILRKDPVLAKYGVRISQFVIKDIDYQDEVHQTINAKQGSLMKTVAAKAEAEKAVQDRLTAEEVGKKNVAVARYEQEVEKTKAITAAEKELEVAKLNRAMAEQYKQTQILKAEGDAEYRRKIMVADGALEKKLNAYVETQKFWASALAGMQHSAVPSVVMGGAGSGGNAALNMMELMTIKAAKDLSIDLRAGKGE